MKGNEVRVVFFLQPVNQFKDGEVTKVEKSFWSHFGFRSLLLLLGLLLGLGVLVFVFLQFGVQTRSQQEAEPLDTPTESPVIAKTGEPESADTERSTEVTSNQSRANNSSTETKLPRADIIQPGKMYDTILCHTSK